MASPDARYNEGMSLREVAEALDITNEAVRQIQNRALRKLREMALYSPMAQQYWEDIEGVAQESLVKMLKDS